MYNQYNSNRYAQMPIPVPQPHIINQQFIPRIISPQTGPIISIPPIRSNIGNHGIPYHQIQNRIIPAQPNSYMPQQIIHQNVPTVGTLTRIN